jgi:hypothetical protein
MSEYLDEKIKQIDRIVEIDVHKEYIPPYRSFYAGGLSW